MGTVTVECSRVCERVARNSLSKHNRGRLAQLEEHSVYTRKVIGSSPIPPIPYKTKIFNREFEHEKEGPKWPRANTVLTTRKI